MNQAPQAAKQIRASLDAAARQLHLAIQDEALMAEPTVEIQDAIGSAAEAIDAALGRLESLAPE